MTRTYALRRLLEHGPMNRDELLQCTRWTGRQLSRALECVQATGLVVRLRVQGQQARNRAFVYEVAR